MSNTVTNQKSTLQGVVYITIAAFTISLIAVIAKLTKGHIPLTELVFSRMFVPLLCLIPVIVRDKNFTFKLHSPGLFAGRSVAQLIALGMFFYAVRNISLTNTITLLNAAPLYIPIIVYLLWKIKTSYKIILSIIFGFIGVLLVLQPGQGFFHSGAFVALLAGIFSATSLTLLRRQTLNHSPNQILFYLFFIGSIATGAVMLVHWRTLSFNEFYYLIALGVIGYINQVTKTFAFQKLPARIASPLTYSSLIFTIIFDYFIWHDIPNKLSIIGIIIITVASILTTYFGYKHIINKK